MNKAAKVLVVFMAVASLSFMAFSAAVLLGGPNWMGMGEGMENYSFSVTEGEKTTFSVASIQGDPALNKQSENAAEVVLEALKHQKTQQSAEEKLLDDQIQNLEGIIAERKSLKAMDIPAMIALEKKFASDLETLNQQISAANDAIKMQTEQSIALNKDLGLYREDVLRLRDQLQLVRADRDRLVERSKELTDILALLKGSIGQMERRTQQLSKQQKYDESVSSN